MNQKPEKIPILKLFVCFVNFECFALKNEWIIALSNSMTLFIDNYTVPRHPLVVFRQARVHPQIFTDRFQRPMKIVDTMDEIAIIIQVV